METYKVIESEYIWIHLSEPYFGSCFQTNSQTVIILWQKMACRKLHLLRWYSQLYSLRFPHLSAPSMASFHHPWHRRLSSRERRHRCWPEVSGNLWESMGIYGTAIANGWASIGISKSQWNTNIKLWSHSTSWGKTTYECQHSVILFLAARSCNCWACILEHYDMTWISFFFCHDQLGTTNCDVYHVQGVYGTILVTFGKYMGIPSDTHAL